MPKSETVVVVLSIFKDIFFHSPVAIEQFLRKYVETLLYNIYNEKITNQRVQQENRGMTCSDKGLN